MITSRFNINFLGYKIHALIFSCLLLGAGIGGYIYHGGLHYSVDFTGGTQVRFSFGKPVGSEQLKQVLHSGGWQDAVIREFNPQDFALRVQGGEHDSQGLAQQIKESLETQLSETSVTIAEANFVGPAAGAELRMNALKMTILGLLITLLYIAIRFLSFSYAVGAIVALLHDPLAILAVLAITQTEISPNVICAILAVMGYSINDTIVIFARIRQRFAIAKAGESNNYIVNDSLNQTLSRTILTSFATFLVVLAFFLFGGESLKNLSLAFMVGVIIGTYSSIFVASPVMLMLRR